MDLNYLFYRQQIETSRAEAARSAPARRAHQEFANAYARKIGEAAGGDADDTAVKANPTMAVAITAREVEH